MENKSLQGGKLVLSELEIAVKSLLNHTIPTQWIMAGVGACHGDPRQGNFIQRESVCVGGGSYVAHAVNYYIGPVESIISYD